MSDFERLKELKGREFNYDNIYCCFLDEEQELNLIINEIRHHTTNIEGYGQCQIYNAYYDSIDSSIYSIYVDSNNIIVDISEYN